MTGAVPGNESYGSGHGVTRLLQESLPARGRIHKAPGERRQLLRRRDPGAKNGTDEWGQANEKIEFVCQNSALFGVRGNGITSRIFAMPVAY